MAGGEVIAAGFLYMRVTRRKFLRLAGPALAGLLAACARRDLASPPPSPAGGSPSPLPRARSATPGAVPPPITAGRLTAVADLYRQTYVPQLPDLDQGDWKLMVEGGAGPFELTWAGLSSFEAVDQMHTLECIGNPVGGRLIGNIQWRGVPLQAILSRAAPPAGARFLVMSSADDYYTSVPLDLALDERSLLAFEANGQPLPRAHGYPARVLLPGVYGQKQPKWVTSMRFSESSVTGTWEKQGWSDTAGIQINSRIDFPARGQRLPANQPLVISGVAFSDLSGVARVEVSTDDGQTWQEAAVYPGPSPMVWTIWSLPWPAPAAGLRVLLARATDGDGRAQTSAEGLLAGVFPDGTAGIHSVVVTVI